MKGQREFQLLIADIRDALSDVARESRYGDLFHATWQLVRFEGELAGDIGKVRELIAVARAIRNATGPGRSVAEQKIMDTLKGIAWTCSSVLEQDGVPRIPDLAAADGLIPDLRRSMLVVAELRDYALESLRFNARPRDAFAGARGGQSFIHAALLTVAETTDSRSTATGALNVLVETGEISDMEALDRLDDWKDKHHR